MVRTYSIFHTWNAAKAATGCKVDVLGKCVSRGLISRFVVLTTYKKYLTGAELVNLLFKEYPLKVKAHSWDSPMVGSAGVSACGGSVVL